MPTSQTVQPQQGWVSVQRAAAVTRAAEAQAAAAPTPDPSPSAASDELDEPGEAGLETHLLPPASGDPDARPLPPTSFGPWNRRASPPPARPAPPPAAPPEALPPPPSRFHLLGRNFWSRLCSRAGGVLGIWPNVSAYPWAGKTALVTGAASPLGEALATALVDRGVTTLLLADHSPHALQPVSARIAQAHAHLPGGATALPAPTIRSVPVDLATPGAGRTLVADLKRDNHHIDILVHNAGFAATGHFELIPLLTHRDVMQVNYLSALELTQEALPAMRSARSGVVLSVAPEGAFEAVPYAATYGSAKGALVNFSESLFQEMRDTGVRVAALCGPPPQRQTAWLPWRRSAATMTGVPPARAALEALQGIDEGQCYIVPTGVTLWKNQLAHELPNILRNQLAKRLHPHVPPAAATV